LAEPKKNIVNDSTFDYTIYKWEGKKLLTPLPGPVGATRIAVGENGNIFIRDQNNKILTAKVLGQGELKQQNERCLLAMASAIAAMGSVFTGLITLAIF